MKLMDKDIARFWSKVEKGGACWLWRAAKHSAGYGVIRIGGSPSVLLYAHRVSYELTKGKIQDGLHLDHLCRTAACVNPSHLEAVLPRTNWERGISPAAQRHRSDSCVKGHYLGGENLYLRPDTGTRQCLKCKHEYWRAWYEKNKDKILARDKERRMEAL